MTRLKTSKFALSILLAASALVAMAPAQAQPMMGGMGMHTDGIGAHEHMTQHWERRQAELKAKLHLASSQEPAWNAFTQGMKPPAKPIAQPLDHDALAKLTTPERLDKMNAWHETNLATMQAHAKQRNDAIRTFYSQLSAEQQGVFDAQTLPAFGRGRRN